MLMRLKKCKSSTYSRLCQNISKFSRGGATLESQGGAKNCQGGAVAPPCPPKRRSCTYMYYTILKQYSKIYIVSI